VRWREQVGVVIGEGVIVTPAPCIRAISSPCAVLSTVISAAIPLGVMSGVPMICSWLRVLFTVERPLAPITIEAMPKATSTTAAT
jgi:hypothetical protein